MRQGLAVVLGAMLAVAGQIMPAHAQMESREAIQLQNQLLEIKRDMQSLRDQVARGGGGGAAPSRAPSAGGSDLTAQLLDRVSRLEDTVRRLQGRLDEVDNARQRDAAALGKSVDDLNFKLGNGAATPATAPRAAPSAGAAAAVPAAPVRRTPELALQEGNAALARRDYPAAEAAAREVLAGSKGPRTTDAQFLLAQSLSGRRDYASAAVAYDDAYQRSKSGSRAQDSLLGLANSLTALGDKKSACSALQKLHAEFPTPRADLRDSIAASAQRAGCH